jgi:SAM-dependent methyltransferase
MTSRPSMYHELAKYYDDIYDFKNYRRETLRLERVARRFGKPRKRTWLDVACGTGRHLELLGRKYATAGVDSSPEMLRIARHRLPGVRLVLGDMRTFHLDRRFDVVSCLFSAIGHLRTDREVRKTFENFGRHLTPGGLAIVEPWIEPSAFRPASVHLRTYESPAVKVVRLAASSRRGDRSVIHYHYLIGRLGRRVQHFEETDVGLMIARGKLLRLMRSAGLEAHFLADGLMPGRGLLIGIQGGSAEAA